MEEVTRIEFENLEAAKQAWQNQRNTIDAAIKVLNEADAVQLAKRTNLLKAMADHQTAIMALPLSKVPTALNDLHTKLQQTVNTELEGLDEAISTPIRTALAEIIRLEPIYATMNEAERIRPAVQYLWDNMTWPNRVAGTATTAPPTLVDAIGGTNDAPTVAPAFTEKNLAIELIEKRIPELRKKSTTASPRAEGVTVCEHIVSSGLEYPTLLSNNAQDIADVAAAAGWEKFNITRIPTGNPKLILGTIAAMIMRGINVTVDPLIKRRLEDQLDVFQKATYRTLLELSSCIKQAKDAASNTTFDSNAQGLFTKVFLTANNHKDRKKMHSELVQLLSNSEEGLKGLASIIDDLKDQDIKDIKDIKKYILGLLPSDKRKDLDAKLKADETKDTDTAVKTFTRADTTIETRAQELFNLLKKPDSNMDTMFRMLITLDPATRLLILKELHKLYINGYQPQDMSKTVFGTKNLVAPPQALVKILPNLLLDATNAQILTLQEEMRTEAKNKLAIAGDNETKFTRFLLESNFINIYTHTKKEANQLHNTEFVNQIKAKGDAATRATYLADNASTLSLNMALNEATLNNADAFAIDRTLLIRRYVELYRATPCEMAMSHLKMRTKPIIEKMTAAEKKQLILELAFNATKPTAADEAILAALTSNGIKNASPSKLFAAQSVVTLDLANDLQERIGYLVAKGEHNQDKISKLIAADIQQLTSIENHNIEQLMTALLIVKSAPDHADNDADIMANQQTIEEMIKQLHKAITEKVSVAHFKTLLDHGEEGQNKLNYLKERLKFYTVLHDLPGAQKEKVITQLKDEFKKILESQEGMYINLNPINEGEIPGIGNALLTAAKQAQVDVRPQHGMGGPL